MASIDRSLLALLAGLALTDAAVVSLLTLSPYAQHPLPQYKWKDGVNFAGAFTDHAVLQRAPQRAAVYGVVASSSCNLTASTGVALSLWRDAHTPVYPIKAQHVEFVNCSYIRWKAALLPMPAGGSYELRAGVDGANEDTHVRLKDITFGDVWFCSGQSNMWLPVHFSFSRNATFEAVRKGKYKTIRMFTAPRNPQPDNAWPNYDVFVAPPPPPMQTYGASQGGGWVLPSVGTYPCEYNSSAPSPGGACGPARNSDEYFNNTIDMFSATCWYFGQHLQDLQSANGEEVVPLGLVHSAWGGTMVEMWTPNATLLKPAGGGGGGGAGGGGGGCKNASGSPWSPSQLHRWDISAAALYQGMVAPFINTTIVGAVWYQGENNLFQCLDGRSAPIGNPNACGSASKGTGYGCFMHAMIESWREAWSGTPLSNTSREFPFGLVSLAGGTSEGFSQNMPAFRLSQTGGTGLLPTAAWPNTFVAQAYDGGDPGDGAAGALNIHDGAGGAYPTSRGVGPFTSYFMGEIHPRPKSLVGERLARAARRVAYGDSAVAWTGPVLVNCSVHNGNQIRLEFDPTLLQGDTLAVRRAAHAQGSAIPLDSLASKSADALSAFLSVANDEVLFHSPLEVQYGGTTLYDGLWLSATLSTKCADGGRSNAPGGGVKGNKQCGIDQKSGTPLKDFNVASAGLPLGGFNASAVTAIRYAFRDNPCCPGVERQAMPCPVASCPIQSYNASLPAVPFLAKVVGGQCTWISTQDGDDAAME